MIKLSSEVYIAGIVLVVLGLRLASESKPKSQNNNSGDYADFMGVDDYFADMAGGVNVFAKGSNIQNEDFVISRKAKPTLLTTPRKVRITNKTKSI
jgi:hypothetical protein